jgi:hypothetical protein
MTSKNINELCSLIDDLNLISTKKWDSAPTITKPKKRDLIVIDSSDEDEPPKAKKKKTEPKKTEPEKPPKCNALTKKGTPCKRSPEPGCELCALHLGKKEANKVMQS